MTRLSLPASILAATLLGGAIVVVHDVVAPTRREISTRVAIASIESYRSVISPRLQGIVRCRYRPTCSVYGLEAVKKYGAVVGGWRAAKRIARCRPGVAMGTVDRP